MSAPGPATPRLLLGLVLLLAALPACRDQPRAVGLLLPLTGRFAQWGTEAREGLLMALDEVNASRPGERRLALVIQDSGSTDEGTTEGFRRLCEQGASVVIGPLTTDLALLAALAAETHEVPMVSPSATGEEFTAASPWAFRYCYTDPEVARALAFFARHDLGLTRLAVAVDLGSRYSLGLGEAFAEAFISRRGRIVGEVTYYDDPAELATVLERLAGLDVEGALIAGYHDAVVAMVEAGRRSPRAAEIGELVLLGSDGWEGPRLADVVPGAVSEAYFSSHFSVGERDHSGERQTLVDRFVRAYEDAHAEVDGPATWPTDFVALGYDTGRAVFDLFDPDLDGAAMRERFRNLRREGVTGTVALDGQGDPLRKSMVFEQVHEPGGPHFVKRGGG